MREKWITDWSILGIIKKQHNLDNYYFGTKEYRVIFLFIPVFYFTN